MRKPITFVLSDESIANSYGFKVSHKGGKLERFLSNPVMLDSHWNSNRYVLGRWQNARFEGKQLKAETDFDYDDKNIEDIIGKVERNFIKGASIGLIFDPIYLAINKDGELILEQWELMEASICPVPSNGNSISLYNTKGELLSENEVKELCLSAKGNNPTTIKNEDKNQKNMEKLKLTSGAILALAAIGITNTDTEADVSTGIEGLQAKLTAVNSELVIVKGEKESLQGKLNKQVELQAKAMLSAAVTDGKITLTEETEMLLDAIANFELTAKLIAKMPGKASLNSQLNNSILNADERKGWTYSEWQEKDPKGLELMFEKDKPAFDKLFVKG